MLSPRCRDGGLPFGDERYWSSSPGRLERMELMAMHFGDQSNSASRQIYLTFPADSTFKDEDVATYFRYYWTTISVKQVLDKFLVDFCTEESANK